MDQLIAQCSHPDVDLRVDALAKLQAQFEAGVEIEQPDVLIGVFKNCLRSSNQHLTTATLSALPSLLPLLVLPTSNSLNSSTPLSPSSSTSSLTPSSLVDVPTLRQILSAFLPAGGIIERLGDKERTQLKAREILILLGGFAFRASPSTILSKSLRGGSSVETPIVIFERYLKELGLVSKVWKVREQSILTLVHIRRTHHLFPLRGYLPLLVATLEDGDAHVRDCSRISIVELFSGPGVTDGARADLKKEMGKKGVRKTIADGVLAKLLGNPSTPQSDGSDSGERTSYMPPSMALQRKPTTGAPNPMSRTASITASASSRPPSRAAETPPQTNDTSEVKPVYIASIRDLESDFAGMAKYFESKESEFNWADRERSVIRVRGMIKGDVHLRYTDAFLACLKDGFLQWSLKTLASLRTTVSVNTCSLYSELVIALGTAMDPFCDLLFTNLLKMAGFTKKIAAQQSQATVTAVITHTSPQPRILLPLLWGVLQEKTVQARAFVVGHLKHFLEAYGHRAKHSIESSGGLEILEKSFKKALADPNPAVRESARVCFWIFAEIWVDRGAVIIATLDSLARKQLEKVCPNPEVAAVLPPVTPKNVKKTSVAAAIAASRAKAKAIATAPPTLRHQATSTSHAVRARSPSPKSPRTPTSRPSSPLQTSTSPPKVSRAASASLTRSVSNGSAHSRSPTGTGRPASPPHESLSYKRRMSSPLAPNEFSPTRSTGPRQVARTPTHTHPVTYSGPRAAVPIPIRGSNTFFDMGNEESLLLASTIPIPEDSDSEMGDSNNLMSFSAPFEMHPPAPRSVQSNSPKSNGSMQGLHLSNPLSSNSDSMLSSQGQPVVEDALRARAEQAESAAERLLELVDPEEYGSQHSTIPASLLVGSTNSTPKSKPSPTTIRRPAPPATPVNRSTAIMRQAAQFQNSPAYNRSSSSLLDVLQDGKHETAWWLKRVSMVAQATPFKGALLPDDIDILQSHIITLEKGEADIKTLQKLAILSIENPVANFLSQTASPPSSPSPFIDSSISSFSLHSGVWDKDKNFQRMLNALIAFLNPEKEEEVIEYGLVLLWEMLQNQTSYFEGRETDVFGLLLTIRDCNKLNVLEATNTIRDALTATIDPVYGLTTMHASLRSFHAQPVPESTDSRASTYAFGLVALGKFILRLPAEIAEEEIPRLKVTLISALNDRSSLVIRESAAASITAAQLVLRDETHLFALLDGLADEKKNLLTYLFDKHGARGLSLATGPIGLDKLQKEMKRLDARTSTPPRV